MFVLSSFIVKTNFQFTQRALGAFTLRVELESFVWVIDNYYLPTC